MEQTPDTYDYRQYDRIWQRVSPTLAPYPGMQTAGTSPAGEADAPAQTPAVRRAEENLPGAEENPCCLGSEALEMKEVLQGFVEEELGDRQDYLALSRQAPAWARQTLREIGEEEGGHARRLAAALYLMDGTCRRPPVSCCRQMCAGQLCPALRTRYHAEVCGGLNYARAADATADPCLARILSELSEDEYRHAEQLMALLERAMR